MNHQETFWKIVLVVLLAPLPIGAWALGTATVEWWRGPDPAIEMAQIEVAASARVELSAGMVRINGGRFRLGGAVHAAHDQLPAHDVKLKSYWIDQHPVTNDQFETFVSATGHVTAAEERGSSLLFDTVHGQWLEVEGANWREPHGPRSSLVARGDFPVVHVSWHDASAYATWAGKRLATEAEYEHAARGGLLDAPYAWGDAVPTADHPLANYWQGRFPEQDLGLDGFRALAPVAQFPPNRYGLYDMAGNVWCWCHDWFDPDYYIVSPDTNPTGPPSGSERVLRGGSWLSTAGANDELAVASRGHASPGHTAGNVGFRCVSSKAPRLLGRVPIGHFGGTYRSSRGAILESSP
ncbi:MAG: formylglycine-generating enzyme family protein [Aeoliella sp.]